MRRRRQQKLEKKLQQFRSRDGGMYYLELFANLKPHVFSIQLSTEENTIAYYLYLVVCTFFTFKRF